MKLKILLVTLWFGCKVIGFADDSKILLKTEIPRPHLISQIIDLPSASMEPQKKGKLPDFFVPLGTTNLALHKPVTASCPSTSGSLSMVTDGDKSCEDQWWLELPEGKQWVQIDLQTNASIYAVWVWHFHLKQYVYKNVLVAVSDDPKFKQNTAVIFNNDFENIMGFGAGTNLNYLDDYAGKLIDAKGVQGRYLRLYSNGNNENKTNHYVEVEVFGKPCKVNSPRQP